ncbi:MAG: hypothetical protein ACLTF1_06350 [Clostridium sp.]
MGQNTGNLLEGPIKALYRKYLFPSISATLVTSIYILADTMMIGRGVGPVGIAALNLLLPVFSLFFGTGMMFGVGEAFCSLFPEEGKRRRCAADTLRRRCFWRFLWELFTERAFCSFLIL